MIYIVCDASYFAFQFLRYASLYFVVGIEPEDNELITLEVIHRYVELLDKYFGNVSALVSVWIVVLSIHHMGTSSKVCQNGIYCHVIGSTNPVIVIKIAFKDLVVFGFILLHTRPS